MSFEDPVRLSAVPSIHRAAAFTRVRASGEAPVPVLAARGGLLHSHRLVHEHASMPFLSTKTRATTVTQTLRRRIDDLVARRGGEEPLTARERWS